MAATAEATAEAATAEAAAEAIPIPVAEDEPDADATPRDCGGSSSSSHATPRASLSARALALGNDASRRAAEAYSGARREAREVIKLPEQALAAHKTNAYHTALLACPRDGV